MVISSGLRTVGIDPNHCQIANGLQIRARRTLFTLGCVLYVWVRWLGPGRFFLVLDTRAPDYAVL